MGGHPAEFVPPKVQKTPTSFAKPSLPSPHSSKELDKCTVMMSTDLSELCCTCVGIRRHEIRVVCAVDGKERPGRAEKVNRHLEKTLLLQGGHGSRVTESCEQGYSSCFHGAAFVEGGGSPTADTSRY